MTEPTFDAQGYPTEETLAFIRTAAGDWHVLLGFVKQAYEYKGYFRSKVIPSKGTYYKLSTGGWSGNEEIISALEQNVLFWTCTWQYSKRGGHFAFFVRSTKEV